MMNIKSVLISLLVLSNLSAKAQERRLSGIILDSADRTPLESATIRLFSDKRTKSSAISNAQGHFSLNTSKDATHITVNLIGYAEKRIAIVDSTYHLGELLLEAKEMKLQEVQIRASPKLVNIQVDKTIYNAALDPLNLNQTALDVLKNTPMVEVVNDQHIRLNMSSPVILINGKLHPMLEKSPATYLRNQPAAWISKVEVSVLPSTKYENRTIINLITKKKNPNSYNGSNRLSITHLGSIDENLSLGVMKGRFTSDISLSGSYDRIKGTSMSSYQESSQIDQKITTSGKSPTHSLSNYFIDFTNSYEINKNNLLTAFFSIKDNIGNNKSEYLGTYHEILSNKEKGYQYKVYNTENSRKKKIISGKIDFQHNISGNDQKLITLSYRINNTYLQKENDYQTENISNFYDKQEYSVIKDKGLEQIGQIDYTSPLGKHVSLEVGTKYIYRDYKDDRKAYLVTEKQMSPINDRSILSKNTNKVSISYLSIDWKPSKSFLARIGANLEYSQLLYSDNSKKNIKNNFVIITPNIALAYIKNDNRFSLTYSKIALKPSLEYMDPFVNKISEKYIQRGNPDLKEMEIHTIGLDYSRSFKNYTVMSSLSYRKQTRGIASFMTQQTDSIYLNTYENAQYSDEIGLIVHQSLSILKNKLRISLMFRPSYINIQNRVENTRTKRFVYLANGDISYQINRKINCNANVQVRSPNLILQRKTERTIVSSYIGMSYIPSRNWGVTLRAHNIFQPNIKNITKIETGTFSGESINRRSQLHMQLSVRYQFGKTFRVKRTRRTIENNDIFSS